MDTVRNNPNFYQLARREIPRSIKAKWLLRLKGWRKYLLAWFLSQQTTVRDTDELGDFLIERVCTVMVACTSQVHVKKEESWRKNKEKT